MKPVYDPDNWEHAITEAHASCNGGCGCEAGFARCEDDPEFRDLHGLTDDRPVTLDHLESIMGRIRRAAGIRSLPRGEVSPAELPLSRPTSAGPLVSPGQALYDEHRGIGRCRNCGDELRPSPWALVRPDGYCGACARELFRCAGSDCLVPLGTPYDTIYVCGCGAGVRLYHDGINYRLREHERYQAAPLPEVIR